MLQVAAGIQRSQQGENPLYLGSWGSYSINDVAAILPQYFSPRERGLCARSAAEEVGRGRRLDQRKGDPQASPTRKAIKRVTEQAYWVPMHTYVSTYAFSKTLNFTPYADELPRFFLAKWN